MKTGYGARLKKLLESVPDVALETDAKNQLRVSLRNARNPRHFDIYEGGSLYRTFLVTIQCVAVAKLLFRHFWASSRCLRLDFPPSLYGSRGEVCARTPWARPTGPPQAAGAAAHLGGGHGGALVSVGAESASAL